MSLTTTKTAAGEWEVRWNGADTCFTIINGDLGSSGSQKKYPNMYGIWNCRTDKLTWIGSLAACKKLLSSQLARRAA